MREQPILFSGPMVRAILEGRKTQTRRVVKPQPSDNWCPTVERYCPTMIDRHGDEYPGPEVFGASDENEGRPCPFGVPGDRLWVRETWLPAAVNAPEVIVAYRADGDAPNAETALQINAGIGPAYMALGVIHRHAGWRPSIYMPRWACRLTLEVKALRVERLQEISEADAEAEGIEQWSSPTGGGDEQDYQRNYLDGAPFESDPVASYRTLWDSINAKRGHSWETNPWVWVVEFERVTA